MSKSNAHGMIIASFKITIVKKSTKMHKKLALLLVVPTYMYALYNPFFTELPAKKQVQAEKKILKQRLIKHYAPAKKILRKSIEMTYFGFVHSNKGKYALVNFNDKNIIVQTNDSLYDDEKIYKVKKITSNSILFKDKKGRMETVYFSSESHTQ